MSHILTNEPPDPKQIWSDYLTNPQHYVSYSVPLASQLGQLEAALLRIIYDFTRHNKMQQITNLYASGYWWCYMPLQYITEQRFPDKTSRTVNQALLRLKQWGLIHSSKLGEQNSANYYALNPWAITALLYAMEVNDVPNINVRKAERRQREIFFAEWEQQVVPHTSIESQSAILDEIEGNEQLSLDMKSFHAGYEKFSSSAMKSFHPPHYIIYIYTIYHYQELADAMYVSNDSEIKTAAKKGKPKRKEKTLADFNGEEVEIIKAFARWRFQSKILRIKHPQQFPKHSEAEARNAEIAFDGLDEGSQEYADAVKDGISSWLYVKSMFADGGALQNANASFVNRWGMTITMMVAHSVPTNPEKLKRSLNDYWRVWGKDFMAAMQQQPKATSQEQTPEVNNQYTTGMIEMMEMLSNDDE